MILPGDQDGFGEDLEPDATWCCPGINPGPTAVWGGAGTRRLPVLPGDQPRAYDGFGRIWNLTLHGAARGSTPDPRQFQGELEPDAKWCCPGINPEPTVCQG